MKKKHILSFMTVVLAVLMVLASCDDGTKNHEDMKIVLEKDVSRTIIPGAAEELNVTSYQIYVTGSAANYEFNSARTTMVLEGVPIGQYTITAKGLNRQKIALVQGSVDFNLNRNNTTATVVLEELIGNGHVNLTFNWDSSRIENEATVKIVLEGEDSSYSEAETLRPANDGSTVSYSKSNLKSGSYIVKAELYDGAIKVSGATEAIRIVDGSTTSGVISFSLDALPESLGQLTLVNKAGTPVVCTISGISTGDNVPAQQPITVSLDVSTFNPSDLTVKWYLNGEFCHEGIDYTFKPSPGPHRLDVIARTNMLGSSGSTQVQFNAALLGAQGEPVVAGVINSSQIALGGRNTMTFLPDGNVMVTSDGARKITVASIVRNSLSEETSMEFTRNVKLASVVNNGKNIVLVHDSPLGSTLFDYNAGTTTIANPVYENGYFATIKEQAYSGEDAIGIVNTATWMENADFAYVGWMNHPTLKETNIFLLRDIDNKDRLEDDYYFTGRRLFQQPVARAKADIFASSADGNELVLLNSNTGAFIAGKNISGVLATEVAQDPALVGTTALAVLPSTSQSVIRLAAAIDDRIVFYEINVETEVSGTSGEAITRSEGAGFTTSKFILSSNEKFLYAFNTGNSSISTYALTDDYRLSLVSKTDLDFAPVQAALSPNGAYMLACAASSDTITMLRIKTSAD